METSSIQIPDLEMFMVINISILYSEMVQFFAKSGYTSLVEWDKKWKINKSSRVVWCAKPIPPPPLLYKQTTLWSVGMFSDKKWEKTNDDDSINCYSSLYILHLNAMFR